MSKLASKVISQAQSWLGLNEADGSHKEIVNIYNSHKPLARGYKLKTTDAWCAATVSAVAIKLGYTDIIPTEVGCKQMIDLFKKMGCYEERDSVVPKPGWVIFYDWNDSGAGDNTGWPDHVGIVEEVIGNTITVIEGNHNNRVQRRMIAVNGKYIRGYGIPKYDAEPEKEEECDVKVSVLKKGDKGNQVKALQALLIGYGYTCGSYGADGSFGPATDRAVRAYQNAQGISVDGSVGPQTWGKLLGV